MHWPQPTCGWMLQLIGQVLVLVQMILYWVQFLPDIGLGPFRWNNNMWYFIAPFVLFPVIDVLWIP
ncbi:MAG TPA: hypothetical protein VKK79_08995, partial [Candidatus Lokiarchaeia archaeon]|nr:hypothetical protein [Candidatus Lokiarchaeia archaeon]